MTNTFFTFVSICLCFSLFGADKEKPLPKEFGALMVLAKKENARAQFAVGQQQNKAGDIKIWVSELIGHNGQSVKRQIGTFYVKENRSDPESRIIGIGFARYFAHKPKGPPVFFLPGGPGGSYIESVPPKFKKSGGPLLAEELLGRCDLVFFDQRGYSKYGSFLKDRAFDPKPAPPNATLQFRVDEFKRFAHEVVERYGRTEVDLRGYSVLECVEDVNELRKKFGYQKIVLRGQSFGSNGVLVS